MIALTLACLVAVAVTVWFETEAFIVYSQLLANAIKYPNFCYLKDYYEHYQDNPMGYPEFLCTYHPNFFSHLFSCSFCTTVVVSILLGLITGLSYIPTTIFFGFAGFNYLKKLINAG